MGSLPDIDCESPVGTAPLIEIVFPEIHHAEHRRPVPLELLPALLASPQSFIAHYGHLLNTYVKGMIDEFPDTPEGRIGDEVRGESLVIAEEVVPRLDIGLDNIDSPGGNNKGDLVGDAPVPGTRLPNILLWRYRRQKLDNHYPNNTWRGRVSIEAVSHEKGFPVAQNTRDFLVPHHTGITP